MKRAKGKRPKKKTSVWTIPTVLGLVLTAVGALGVITLQPQLSVSPLDQLISGEPFFAPFEITNTGYIGIHIDYVTVIFPRVEFDGTVVTNGSTNDRLFDDFDLGQGGTATIVPHFSNGKPRKGQHGDRDRLQVLFDTGQTDVQI